MVSVQDLIREFDARVGTPALRAMLARFNRLTPFKLEPDQGISIVVGLSGTTDHGRDLVAYTIGGRGVGEHDGDLQIATLVDAVKEVREHKATIVHAHGEPVTGNPTSLVIIIHGRTGSDEALKVHIETMHDELLRTGIAVATAPARELLAA
jgi:hypothetical protein